MNQRNSFSSMNKHGAECNTCLSRHMSMDEIAKERQNSGWNPYWAEEENDIPDPYFSESKPVPDRKEERQIGLCGPLMWTDPELEAQRLAERDLRQLQSVYPASAKLMLPYIEEICDKMEYDGSSMYDQYPDRANIYRLAEEIYEKVKEQFPAQHSVEKDEMLAMQYPPRPSVQEPVFGGYNQPGMNWVRDLAQILLLNEMHHRRRRKKNLFK